MTTDIDHILDRRGLRKKLSLWRVLAILALIAAFVAVLAAAGAFKALNVGENHIARVTVDGVITEDHKLLAMLRKIKTDDSVKGVILRIDSAGGTTVGGEALFHAIREIAEEKPVAASIGTLAASAGYMIATASDHIVARHTSIIGSIGVLIQYPEASGLLNKVGVAVNEVKSSPLKAEPSPFHKAPPESVAMLKRLVDDSYQWFVSLVTDRRPLTRSQVLEVADGSVFSGNQSKKLGLIDAIGGEQVAKDWLVKEKKLSEDLKITDWKKQNRSSPFPFSSAIYRWLTGNAASPLEGIGPDDLPGIIPRRLFLDGMLSVWHG